MSQPVETPRPSCPTVGGYPLGVVARRLHEPSRCVSCGAGFSLWRVNVRAVADGRRTTVDLCEQCFASDDGAWRLRWQPVPYER
jgi:hypothetical protein